MMIQVPSSRSRSFATVSLAAAISFVTVSNPPSGESAESAPPPVLGLRTASYHAPDLVRAKDWYSAVLRSEPCYNQPYYVGLNVGGFELGLDPDTTATGAGSVVVYWGVADATSALRRLLSLRATEHTNVREVGGGIRVATVLDPFGNVPGVIENPHFTAPDTSPVTRERR